MTAAEKLRREKWVEAKQKEIKELTVKGLEPEIARLIARHKQVSFYLENPARNSIGFWHDFEPRNRL